MWNAADSPDHSQVALSPVRSASLLCPFTSARTSGSATRRTGPASKGWLAAVICCGNSSGPSLVSRPRQRNCELEALTGV